jgi:hypothetical protein
MDLICIPSLRSGWKKVAFIQVKWNRKDMSAKQKSALALFSSYYGALAILEYRDKKTRKLVTEICEV